VDDRVAREWGRRQAAVANRGGQPRRRSADLAIAATANVHEAVLVTHNVKEFAIIATSSASGRRLTAPRETARIARV
jgi:toxin FitB